MRGLLNKCILWFTFAEAVSALRIMGEGLGFWLICSSVRRCRFLEVMLVEFSSPWYLFLPRSEEVARRPLLFQHFSVFGAVECLSGVLSAFFAGSLLRIGSVASASAACPARSSHLVPFKCYLFAC